MEPKDPLETQSPQAVYGGVEIAQETVVVPASLPTDPAIPQSDFTNPFIPSINVPPRHL